MKFALNQFSLYKGQDDQILIALLDDDGMPVNIYGATAITVRIVKSDNTIFEKAPITGMVVGVVSPIWVYSFAITNVESMDLPVGLKQTIELKVTMGSGAVRYIPIKNCLNVASLPF